VKKITFFSGAIILAALALAMGSCYQQPEPDYASAITENILQAINTGDYARYSEHFDDAMKNALPEAVFKENNTVITGKIGTYVSKEYKTTVKQAPYTIVYYKAKFTGESKDVTVKVIFQQIDGKNYVSGLWMTSPNLSK
jgi:hypothetical protein